MILHLQEVHKFYGLSHILFGVSLGVEKGETVVLLGRNGAGKTTTLRSIMGLTSVRSGDVIFEGRSVVGKTANVICELGVDSFQRTGGSSRT